MPTVTSSSGRSAEPSLHISFVRHGATAPNLAGLRCGGDLDVPLTDIGRVQAELAATRVLALGQPVGIIVTGALQRTQETASIISHLLGGVQVVTDAAFDERRLGAWNLLPINATEPWFVQRLRPPGGEADDDFTQRIANAARALLPRLHEPLLLVASKGVARVFGELLGQAQRVNCGNGELKQFDLSPLALLDEAARCTA